MSWLETLKEACASVVSRPLHALVCAIAVAALAAGAFLMPWHAIAAAQNSLIGDVKEGRSVIVIGGNDLALSSNRCDSLRRASGVVSAGAVIGRTINDAGLSVLEVSPGLPALQWPTSRAETAVDVAIGAGRVILLDNSADGNAQLPRIDYFATSRGRIATLDSAVLVTSVRNATVSECFVEAEPGAERPVAEYAAALLTRSSATGTIPLIPGSFSGENGQKMLNASPHLILVLVSVGLVVLLGCGLMWGRRHEQAVYQQLGMSAAGVMAMSFVEWVMLVATPSAAGLLVSLMITGLPPASVVLVYSLWCFVMFVTGTLLSPLLVSVMGISLGRTSAGKI